jgi:glycolate oxidase iron-sulfur subunit
MVDATWGTDPRAARDVLGPVVTASRPSTGTGRRGRADRRLRALRLLPATCPTYVLWGEEMDSPRGRIYLMSRVSRASR